VHNHLEFTVLVHESHGEYREARANLNANLAMESLDVRKLLADKDAEDEEASEFDAEPSDDTDAESSTAAASAAETPAVPAAGKPVPAGGKPTLFMVVGFEVRPCSVKRTPDAYVDKVNCDGTQEMQEVKAGERIVYTYDVYFENSNHKWASRWDAYLKMPGGKVLQLSAASHASISLF
jgi:transmembrane 9 superfamily member 2/4